MFNYAHKKFLVYVFLVLINAGWSRVFLFKSGHKAKDLLFFTIRKFAISTMFDET